MQNLISIRGLHCTAVISSIGAELKSVKHDNGTEFMWQGQSDIWPRTAPVLFPIVGKVKNDRLKINHQPYAMGQHGFARDLSFTVHQQTENSIVFQLLGSQQTREKYPFEFKLLLSYTWQNDTLHCGYEVQNLDAEVMPFSIGGHPGFIIPNGDMKACELNFNRVEEPVRHMLTDGLFNHQTAELPWQNGVLKLDPSLFDQDAIVFKKMLSTQVVLKHTLSTYQITMDYDGFPYLGIWSKKGMQRFVCLEPWFGHADFVEGHEEVQKKEGIQLLPSHQNFKASYALTFSA